MGVEVRAHLLHAHVQILACVHRAAVVHACVSMSCRRFRDLPELPYWNQRRVLCKSKKLLAGSDILALPHLALTPSSSQKKALFSSKKWHIKSQFSGRKRGSRKNAKHIKLGFRELVPVPWWTGLLISVRLIVPSFSKSVCLYLPQQGLGSITGSLAAACGKGLESFSFFFFLPWSFPISWLRVMSILMCFLYINYIWHLSPVWLDPQLV